MANVGQMKEITGRGTFVQNVLGALLRKAESGTSVQGRLEDVDS